MSFHEPATAGKLGLGETRAAFEKHLVARGDHTGAWDSLADLFAEDASYYDVFYGWMYGREAIREFLRAAMKGIEDWTFPAQWSVITEGRVVVHWMNRLPGRRPDGAFYEFPGTSSITFDDAGRIVQQMDIYDGISAIKVIFEAKLGGLGPTGARLLAATGAGVRESVRALYGLFSPGDRG